jgi:hypothetical protein
MAETKYTYNLSDLSNGIAAGRLTFDIQNSAIVTALERIDIDDAGGTYDVVFKDILSSTDKNLLDGDTAQAENIPPAVGSLLGDHSGIKLTNKLAPPKDYLGHTIVAPVVALRGGFRYITHNFCDKQTWWQESTDHVDAATTDEGAQLTYDITGHANLTDLRHGRATFENEIDATTVAPNGNTMTNIIPTVEIDTVALPQANEKDSPSIADEYSIDYVNGKVTFGAARGGAEVVTVSFRKAGSSKWTLKPPVDHKYVVEDVEIDVSESLDMTEGFCVLTFGSHPVLTGGTIAQIKINTYKTFHDFQAAAREFFGPLPANFGLTGGVNSPKWTFKWQYIRADEVYATANYLSNNYQHSPDSADDMTVNRVELETINDGEYGGDFLTMTFYGKKSYEGTGD